MDLHTSLKKDLGVLRKLKESRIFSNKFIKNVECPINSSTSKSMVLSPFGEKCSCGFSDKSGFGESDPIIGKTVLGFLEVHLCFTQGVFAGGVLVGRSFEGNLSFGDFCISECFLLLTGIIVSAEHFFVLCLFEFDLCLEIVEEIEDIVIWATGFDHGFDLGKDAAEGGALEGGVAGVLEGNCLAECNKTENEYGFHFDYVVSILF